MENGWSAAWLDALDVLVVIEQFGATEMLVRADVALPLAAWSEIEGTWVNGNGRVQRLRPATPAAGEAWPGWRIAAAMGERAGWTGGYPSPREVLDEIAAQVDAFQGLSYPAIGLGGADLATARTS